MERKRILEQLEKFRDLEISKCELYSSVGDISFGDKEGILTPNHVISLLEAFQQKKITEEDITNWVDIIWWLGWFRCNDEQLDSIVSVIGELDMLEDIPYLRTDHLTTDEAQYYIDALKNNEDISFKPYKSHE